MKNSNGAIDKARWSFWQGSYEPTERFLSFSVYLSVYCILKWKNKNIFFRSTYGTGFVLFKLKKKNQIIYIVIVCSPYFQNVSLKGVFKSCVIYIV